MNVIKYHEPWLIERFSRAADDSYFLDSSTSIFSLENVRKL